MRPASARWLPLVTCLAACGADETPSPSLALSVNPPDGTACVGVTGFEVSVSIGGRGPVRDNVLLPSPVLAADQCRFSAPASFDGLPPDVGMDVTVTGFDGVRQARVAGAAHLVSLEAAGEAWIQLVGTSVSGRPVLTIDRTTLFSGLDVDRVERIEIGGARAGDVLLDRTVDQEVRPFFTSAEPTAVTLTTSPPPGEPLLVTLFSVDGGPKRARIDVRADSTGLFLYAAPAAN